MKFLLINSWCDKGSTGKIVFNFYNYLKNNNHEVHYFHGRDNNQDDNNIIRMTSDKAVLLHAILARLTGLQGFFSTKQTNRLIKFIEKYKPDYVYLFNLHGYYLNEYKLLKYLKSNNIKVVYMLFDEYPYLGKQCFSEQSEQHGESMIETVKKSSKKEYPKSMFFDTDSLILNKKNEIYRDWNNLVFTSVQYIKEQAALSIIKDKRFISFDMGVDLTHTFFPRETKGIKEKYGIPENRKIVLTVGFSSDTRKGIDKFITLARKFSDDTVFVNVGYDQNVEKDLPSNFIPISYVANQDDMAQLYSVADLYLTTSSGEAMSNACLEALGCGTPIAGFWVSGMPYLADNPIGRYAPYNDLEKLAELVNATECKTKLMVDRCHAYALKRFRSEDYLENLYQVSQRFI